MNPRRRTARLTGVAYLALAVFGMAGFLMLRPQLYTPESPADTLVALQTSPGLSQLAVGLELAVVAAQALAALGFFALFLADRPVLGFAVAAFGMVNATAILGSAVMLSAALAVAEHPAALAPAGGAASTVGLLYELSDGFWLMGGLFFGLWLIPMGMFVLSTGRMPRLLGWALVVGGSAYILGTGLQVLVPGAPVWLVDGLPILATVGELWMIGYLLICGIRPARPARPAMSASSGQQPSRTPAEG